LKVLSTQKVRFWSHFSNRQRVHRPLTQAIGGGRKAWWSMGQIQTPPRAGIRHRQIHRTRRAQKHFGGLLVGFYEGKELNLVTDLEVASAKI
jgi:hypothetical protein